MGYLVTSVTIAQTGTTSDTFHKHQFMNKIGALIPDIDAATITLQFSDDGGTTWYPVLDPFDGDDYVICKSGSDPGFIDFTDVCRPIPVDKDPAADKYLLRFLSSAAQNSAAVTIKVFERD